MELNRKVDFHRAIRPPIDQTRPGEDHVGRQRGVFSAIKRGDSRAGEFKDTGEHDWSGQGEEMGRRKMKSVLGKEGKMSGILIKGRPETTSEERQYLMGYWRGVADVIKEEIDPTLDGTFGWNAVVQKIEGRIRDAQAALASGADNAKIDMGDVEREINELASAGEEETKKLAA